jgi:hypothetical protein
MTKSGKMLALLLITILGLLHTGCTPSPIAPTATMATPMPASAASLTPTFVSTATATLPTNTPTRAPTPTLTLIPTSTAIPEITNTETPVQPSHTTPDEKSIDSESRIEEIPGDFWKQVIQIPYNELRWKSYRLNGLPHVWDYEVYSIAIVSNQKAWIGTNYGLWKYENNRLEDFTAQGQVVPGAVFKVKIAPDGKLWLNYRYQSGNWISSWDEKGDRQDYSFPEKVIDFAISKEGTVWVAYSSEDASRAGLSFYQNHTWHPVQIGDGSKDNNKIRSMFASSDGSVWFDTRGGLFRIKENQWTRYDRKFKSYADGEWMSSLSYMTEGPDGTLWGVRGFTIYHYTGQGWESYYKDHPSGIGLGAVAVSKDGKIWAGHGFIKDGKNYDFTDPPFFVIYAIQTAPNGSVWYGTTRGLIIYDNLE